MVDSSADARPAFYEFFAGGGMVRAGLGDGWRCLFANDINPGKAAAYRENWGWEDFHLGDIGTLDASVLPGRPDLVWGSFPCQDLSLAGAGAGLEGGRSGTFHAFFDIVRALAADRRAPRLVVIENVCGALTSRGGQDFETICRTFVEAGYRPGPLVINADLFVPQSRPRLFVIGLRDDAAPDALASPAPELTFHPAAVMRAVEALPVDLRSHIVWWNLPEPGLSNASLTSIVEPDTPALRWRKHDATARLLAQMSPLNRAKVDTALRSGTEAVGAVFRRTRTEAGRKVQRAEVRFDRAGCLRTPAGGSSRQILLVIRNGEVRSRLMTGRETARLMGLQDNYRLPHSESAALRLTGDGVAVPVVAWLSEQLLKPLLGLAVSRRRAA
ncbi:DNA cytosine methyltransferase [Brevundimonas sp. NPDC092305]|uniref:DNA cytosine methyltransferase n=1 Tax=Brevundimonas sp. NPDC092305 TaxID=3363957 RepID=UPI0037F74D0D